MIQTNPWAAKAKALDRYRWALLRERHGLLGSGLRFAREMLGDWWFGFRAKRRLAVTVVPESCEFLLLQSAPKVIAFQRKKLLIQEMRSRGHNLLESALQAPSVILSKRQLKQPTCKVPTRYFGLAAHAKWLVDYYQPRILLNDRNGSFYAPFLRLALSEKGSILVHLAHASTVEGSRRLGMNDYDYYFLFGQSSLEALQARTLRFGCSTAVLSGSHMIDGSYDLEPAEPSLRTVLILGVGPDKEREIGYQATYALLRDWAMNSPEYKVLVKPHPRSGVSFWQQTSRSLSNVEVLPRECSLAVALSRASVVINIMSNAVIEAALARRPVLPVNVSGQSDIFEQERFFGECIVSSKQLQERLTALESDYVSALQKAVAFSDYHLSQGNKGLEHTIFLLEHLLHGGDCPGSILPERGIDKAWKP